MSQTAIPRWADLLHRVAGWIIGDETSAGWVPLNAVIDLHKAATGVFVLVLMQAYTVFTPAAWTYLALHGTYGIAWVLKDVTVGDRKWRHRVGLGGVFGTLAFLTLYWVAPVILILGTAGTLDLGGWRPGSEWSPPSTVWLAVAVVAYVAGLVLMIGADAQKNATLRERSRRPGGGTSSAPGLITTSFYARIRHPNYLGEMLIYGSFALVAGHWLPWGILAAIWGLFFLPNMLAIEASLSRYPEYEAWRKRTGFLLPWGR
jgi:protein-S-isoprenylcysteine O-methyltransferase Ste14